MAERRAEVELNALNSEREKIHARSPMKKQPVDFVRWVPIEQVTPNDYNPNSVAKIELGLLHTSIKHDGYTMPIVTIWDDEQKKYVIVDGFHRYYTMKTNRDIYDSCNGHVPIVVIDKDINERMASTVRHNRARGEHTIKGMSALVFSMLENGWEDKDICNHLGMGPEELLRLKHITGFSKLFADTEYRRSWVTKAQIRVKREYEKERGDAASDAS